MTATDTGTGVARLGLLASAFAGRSLEVAPLEHGSPPWTDGWTVFIDADAPEADQVLMIGVQSSLLASGSLGPDVVRQLIRRPALAGRYLAVEGHRALAANEDVLPQSVRRLIDRHTAADLTSPSASLERARSRRSIDDAPRVFGSIDARRMLAGLERAEAARASAEAGAGRSGETIVNEPAELAENDDDGANLGQGFSSPVGGGSAMGRLLGRLLSPARNRRVGGPAGADTPTHFTSAPGAGGTVAATSLAGALEEPGDITRTGVAYPEWDVHRRRYRSGYCTVLESVATIEARTAAPLLDAGAFRRPLTRLGLGLGRVRRQTQGEDIDIDAAVQTRVDTVAGRSHDGAVYIGSRRMRRDLAALVLLDVSGSSGQPGIAGTPVHEQQRSVAAALTAALHELGDRVALYGFNSRGRQAVQLRRVKAFDDALDAAVAQRLAGLTPSAFTRLGAAVRHGATILEERGGTPHRLLVVLSDGFAYDHGYEGRYAEADARRALVEARRRGTGCLCLSVGTDADPVVLRRVFGTAAHATVPRAEQLPAVIAPLFRSALRSAEAHRRAFQRTARTKERLQLERSR